MAKLEKQEFAELIEKYRDEMYYLALSILRNETDAQDAVGEAVVRAYEARFRLRKIEKFKPWLMQILVNVSKTLLKRRKKIVLTEETETINQVESEPEYGLWDVIVELEYEFRTVIVLYYYEGFSTKEIAKILDIPEGTVRSRLTRAREKLKKFMETERK